MTATRPSATDEEVARGLAELARNSPNTTYDELAEAIATALSQRGAQEREAIAKWHDGKGDEADNDAVFRVKTCRDGVEAAGERSNVHRESSAAIRAGGKRSEGEGT